MRKTKIIATIGPSTEAPDTIERLLQSGVNAVRLNFSHGTMVGHEAIFTTVRAASKKLNLPVAIIQDLAGPKIRIGRLKGGSVELPPGHRITITTRVLLGDGNSISTTYRALPEDVKPGARILIDDGLIELQVLHVSGSDIECNVVHGGVLKEHKGINLPGVDISAPALTDKDIEDLDLGISLGVDYVALSFVRKAADIVKLKEHLKAKCTEIPVIAKIEKQEAVDNLEEILDESEGIMVARGDLGVELSPEEIPVLQKRMISIANKKCKIVITATQMLESMINNPRPTRAEASDVANAIFDGTDAVMLSGETAVGKYPVKTVEIMSKIAVEAEGAILHQPQFLRKRRDKPGSFGRAVAYASCVAAWDLRSKVIVVFTQSGNAASLISKFRPSTPIVAFTSLEGTMRRLSLSWGVQPFCIEFGNHTDEMICRGEAALLNHGIAEWGDILVIVSGTRVGMRGGTNMMKIDKIGSDECRVYLAKESPGM